MIISRLHVLSNRTRLFFFLCKIICSRNFICGKEGQNSWHMFINVRSGLTQNKFLHLSRSVAKGLTLTTQKGENSFPREILRKRSHPPKNTVQLVEILAKTRLTGTVVCKMRFRNSIPVNTNLSLSSTGLS